MKKKPEHMGVCVRCGTCCKKGGPGFHTEDKFLIETGIVPLKHLYTLRKGEMVWDNVRDRFLPTETDIIKMKSGKDFRTCFFFDGKENRCGIYKNRPFECRVLKCWDTRQTEEIYSKNRLSRKDLLSDVRGLWELLEDHQERCDYEKIRCLVKNFEGKGKADALSCLSDIIGYDTHIRILLTEKGVASHDVTDFLFGRPLRQTIGMFGLKFESRENRSWLRKIG
ncbi:MAG: hypothetical protein B6245_00375 [Desulfobacteraceae bacterium 4572_88]|nr:MAG: hypothetical protein B6245_00375 [Desulfobacteraceae bacterium 4572_88]